MGEAKRTYQIIFVGSAALDPTYKILNPPASIMFLP